MHEMMAKYRKVFTDKIGKDVLSDILLMCHFGNILDGSNQHQIGEYNIGIAILQKCGILRNIKDPNFMKTWEDVINQLCLVFPKEEKTEKEEEE